MTPPLSAPKVILFDEYVSFSHNNSNMNIF